MTDDGKVPESCCGYCASVLRRHVKAFRSEIPTVSTGLDVEAIHRIRVASRRIQAVFPLFAPCIGKEDYRRWRREIKAAAKALGEARDLDVQIGFVDSFTERTGNRDTGEGLSRLRRELAARREAVQSQVGKALSVLEDHGTLDGIRQALRQFPGPKARDPGALYPPVLNDRALDSLLAKIFQVLVHEEYVHCPECIRQHHALRIDIKRLRYTLETFAPLYPDRMMARITVLREIQDLLGEMHDCDVWISMLPSFMEDEIRASGTSRQDAVRRLFSDRQKRRDECFRKFSEIWERERINHAWRDLVTAIHVPAADRLPTGIRLESIGIIGSINGNREVLEAIARDARENGVECLVIAGNLAGRDGLSREIVRICRKGRITVVPGARDQKIGSRYRTVPGGKKEGRGNESKKPAGKNREGIRFFRGLPRRLVWQAGDRTIWIEPSLPDEWTQSRFAAEILAGALPADIIVTGGRRRSAVSDGVLVLSPGPAVDRDGRAGYTILNAGSLTAEYRELPEG